MKIMHCSRIIISLLLLITDICPAMQKPNASYHSAGILPYAVDNQNNIWLLVGLEPGRNNQAFDFGGKKDPEDNNNSAFTAAREGSEELLFIYDEDEQDFQRILNLGRTKGKNFDISKANSRTFTRILDKINDKTTTFSTTARGYITYLVQVTYRPDVVPQLFAQRRQNYGKQLPYSWAEKNHLVWLNLRDVLNAMQQSKNEASIYVPSKHGMIHIFPHFAISLIALRDNGTFNELQKRVAPAKPQAPQPVRLIPVTKPAPAVKLIPKTKPAPARPKGA